MGDESFTKRYILRLIKPCAALVSSLLAPALASTAQQCETPAKVPYGKTNAAELPAKNVLGTSLEQCGCKPMTGFYRDGFCHTETRDFGSHTVCAVVTDEFLSFTRSRGNDLSAAAPQFNFPGLKAGDRWCLCVSRWKEAYDAHVAPPVILEATHERALKLATIEELRSKELRK
jgi:uncharacterized protein (DUF2237 family)